jgi:hypothetical protein
MQKKVFILIFAILVTPAVSLKAQSSFRLDAQYINIFPETGSSPLTSYLMRFGSFSPGFTPTPQNISSWDANFTGFSGSYSPSLFNNPQVNVVNFSLTNNSLIPVGRQLYMVVYDVAPDSSPATAQSGAMITRTNWTMGGAGRDTRGRWTNHFYYATGVTRGIGNYDEDNIGPPTIDNWTALSSPVNTLVFIPTGAGTFGTVQTSFDMVPEPSTYALLILAAAGLVACTWRRRSKVS